jgi:hypothetical protein
VGLGVSGAGELGVQEGEQVNGEVTSPLELTQFVRRFSLSYSSCAGARSEAVPSGREDSRTRLTYSFSQVDNLLNDLESRFDTLSADVLSRRTPSIPSSITSILRQPSPRF